MKKLILLLLFVSLLMIRSVGLAAGLDHLCLSVTETGDGEPMPAAAVQVYERGSKAWFFVPGGADLTKVRLWFSGSKKTTVNGRAVQNGGLCPEAASGTLTVTQGKSSLTITVMQGSPIGALFLTTDSGSMNAVHKSKETKEPGELTLLDSTGQVACTEHLDHLKLRGNTSTAFARKNYGFKMASGHALMGMNKAKRWVLIGNDRDHTLLRNQIVLELARRAGLPYVPDCRQVELYLNREYRGTYLLTEKIEINEGRVDIADLEDATKAVNDQPLGSFRITGPERGTYRKYKACEIPNDPEDITGGYILEYENWLARYKTEDCAYTTAKGNVILIKDPQKASQAQAGYISSLMQSLENAIFAKDGIDPDTGKHYSEIADLPSLVRKFMLEEIVMNCDGSASSQYFFKAPDSVSTLIYAGPPWDYDTCLGDYAETNDRKLMHPDELYHTRSSDAGYWWPELYRKEDFRDAVRLAWAQSYASALRILTGLDKSSGSLLSVDSYAEAIRDSAAMTFTRWKMTTEKKNIVKDGETFEECVAYLKDFILKRYEFLETQWSSFIVSYDE